MAVPAMTSNSPSAGHISWDLFHIQYEGVGYEVAAGSTSDRWVWWRYNAGVPVVETGAVIPVDLVDDDLVLFGNKDGIPIRIQNANLIDGELLIDGSIFANALSTNLINTQHIVTAGLDAGVIKFGVMSGDRIEANTIHSEHVVAEGLDAGVIRFGEMSGDRILANTITSDHVVAEGLDAGVIRFGEMSGDRIVANTINGDHLVGEVILASTRIAAVGPDGQSVELNPSGFFVYGPTSEGNPPYVSFPTESGNAGKPNIISGTLQATTLSVDGNPVTGQAATFRLNSQLEPGATFTLNNSVVAPVAMPTAETIVNERAGIAVTGDIAGMTYHPADNAIYFTTNDFTMPGGVAKYTVRVYKFALATNTMSFVRTIQYGALTDVPSKGITYFNNHFHVGYDDGGDAVVVRYDNAWVQNASANFGAIGGDGISFTVGNDGTNLWIGDFGSTTTSDAFRFRKYLNTLSIVVQETINTTSAPSRSARANTEIFSLNVGNFDFGARKFIVTYNSAKDVSAANTRIDYDMNAFATAGGARDIDSEFHLMRKLDVPVLAWKGASNNDVAGTFLGVTCAGTTAWVNFYSNLRTTNRSDVWYTGSSFFRTSDSSETTMSPQNSFTMNGRWNWKVTAAAAPSGLVSRVYISQTALGAATARLQATLAAGVTAVSSAVYNAAGALAKTVSTFGSTVASSIQSQETITQLLNLATTSGSTTVTGAGIQNYMVGKPISGTGIQAGSTIVSAIPGVSAELSLPVTGSFSNINANLTLPKMEIRGSGYARITELERVIVSSTDDANLLSTNQPALRVGDVAGGHLRIDGNEILAMSNPSTQGILVLNSGGAVTISGYIKTGVRNSGTLVANTEKTIAVSFPVPFPANAPIPTVHCQVIDVSSLSSSPQAVSRNATRSGFDMTFRRTTTSAFDVAWTAIAQ